MRRLVVGLLILPFGACIAQDVAGPGTSPQNPQPVMTYGPPGGYMDPQQGYGQPGMQQGAEMPGYPQGYPDGYAPGSEQVAADGTQLPPGEQDPNAVPTDDPQALASVTDVEIDATLEPYGEWVEDEEYGRVWRPYTTVVGQDFTPYESCGSWVWTDYGWTFTCDWDWGWLPFHYGQWDYFDDGWAWIPGYDYSPAWVDWRSGGDYVGWRPSEPQIRDHRHHGSTYVRDHRHPARDAHWRFARVADFARPHIRSHLFKQGAEALGATAPVTKLTMRGQQSISAASLMRNRLALRGQIQRSGGAGVPYRPSYRPLEPGRAAMPVYQSRPTYQAPVGASTGAAADPGSSGIVAPINVGGTAQPTRTIGPDTTSVSPPVYAPQAPVAPTSGYQAPTTGPIYSPPSRSYTPPPSTYQAPTPAPTYTPPPTYSPPVRYAPPSRRSYYTPPSRPTYTPPTRYSSSYSPPSRSSYTAPSRSYSSSYSAPSRSSYSAPSRSYSSSYSAPSHSSYSAPSHSFSSGGGGFSHSSGGGGGFHGGGGGHRR